MTGNLAKDPIVHPQLKEKLETIEIEVSLPL